VRRRSRVFLHLRLLVERTGQNAEQASERAEVIIVGGSGDGIFDAVVAGYVLRIDRAHSCGPMACWLSSQPLTPACCPTVKCGGIDEVVTYWSRSVDLVSQIPKCKGEIRAVAGHQDEQLAGKIKVARRLRKQPDLVAEAFMERRFVECLERPERSFRLLETFIASAGTIGQEGQQRFSQPCQVPDRDAGLVGIGIAAFHVDRTEHGGRMIGVHERTWAVVDGLSGNCDIIRIKDTMDEA